MLSGAVPASLRGVGQIMLQPHAGAGLLFLLGLAVAAWPLALAAVLGAAGGTVLAQALRFPQAEIDQGLYGFNAALVALAAWVFYGGDTGLAWSMGLAAGALATVQMRAMQRWGMPAYTFPFVLWTWGALWLVPPAPLAPVAAVPGSVWWDGWLQGLGQVMFAGGSVTGGIFALGLLLASRRAAVSALLGSGLGLLVAWSVQGSAWAQALHGLQGYNPALAAIALAPLGWGAALCGALLAMALTHAMHWAQWPVLTFPFIAACWCVLAGRKWRKYARQGA